MWDIIISYDSSDPEVIKILSYSAQQSMKFVLLINLKLLTILNSFLLNIAEHDNFSALNIRMPFSYHHENTPI